MVIAAHGTKIIDEDFGGAAFTSLNGRTPNVLSVGTTWNDGTTAGTRFSGAGTASLATGSNRAASISIGQPTGTVEATLNFNGSATTGLEAGIGLMMASALTAITGPCYRLEMLPNTTPKFSLKRQTTTLTSSNSFSPANNANWKARLICRFDGSSHPQFSASYDALGGSGWQTITWLDSSPTNTADSDTFTDDSVSAVSTGNFAFIFASAAVNIIFDDFRVYTDGSVGPVSAEEFSTILYRRTPGGLLVPRPRRVLTVDDQERPRWLC